MAAKSIEEVGVYYFDKINSYLGNEYTLSKRLIMKLLSYFQNN